MVLMIVVYKLKSLILLIVAIFKRALCCLKRRKVSIDSEPLIGIGVVSDDYPQEDKTWNNWDNVNFTNKKPESVQDYIDLYRQQKMAMFVEQDNEKSETNFFENMTPKITKQKKLLINTNNSAPQMNTHLSLDPDTKLLSKELGEWEENPGWEGETLDWDAQEVLKQKKRQERERKALEQQQRRLERSGAFQSQTLTIS